MVDAYFAEKLQYALCAGNVLAAETSTAAPKAFELLKKQRKGILYLVSLASFAQTILKSTSKHYFSRGVSWPFYMYGSFVKKLARGESCCC